MSSMISSRVPTDMGDPRRSSTLLFSSSARSVCGLIRSWFATNSSSMSSQSLTRSSLSLRSMHLLAGVTFGRRLAPSMPFFFTFLPTRVGGAGGCHFFFSGFFFLPSSPPGKPMPDWFCPMATVAPRNAAARPPSDATRRGFGARGDDEDATVPQESARGVLKRRATGSPDLTMVFRAAAVTQGTVGF